MPRGCEFCGVGVMVQCTVPGCGKYLCPGHRDAEGRCHAPDLGVFPHAELAEPEAPRPQRRLRRSRTTPPPEEPAEAEATEEPATEGDSAVDPTAVGEPATTEP